MDVFLEIVFRLLLEICGAMIEIGLEWLIDGLVRGEWFTSETWEWFGAVGAAVWLAVSFGRVKWEATDRRAITSGVMVLGGTVAVLGWSVLAHYAAAYGA
jgi:hypothetical protein